MPKISQLPLASSLGKTDKIPIVQGGVTKYIPAGSVTGLCQDNIKYINEGDDIQAAIDALYKSHTQLITIPNYEILDTFPNLIAWSIFSTRGEGENPETLSRSTGLALYSAEDDYAGIRVTIPNGVYVYDYLRMKQKLGCKRAIAKDFNDLGYKYIFVSANFNDDVLAGRSLNDEVNFFCRLKDNAGNIFTMAKRLETFLKNQNVCFSIDDDAYDAYGAFDFSNIIEIGFYIDKTYFDGFYFEISNLSFSERSVLDEKGLAVFSVDSDAFLPGSKVDKDFFVDFDNGYFIPNPIEATNIPLTPGTDVEINYKYGGGTVFINAGRYPLVSQPSIDSNLNIFGIGQPLLYWSGIPDVAYSPGGGYDGGCIVPKSMLGLNNVKIEGLIIDVVSNRVGASTLLDPTKYGVGIVCKSYLAEDRAHSSYVHGMFVSNNISILNCLLKNGSIGIEVGSGFTHWRNSVKNVNITNCNLIGGQNYAIELTNVKGGNVNNNIINKNNIQLNNSTAGGIQTIHHCNRVNIVGNTISKCQYGVRFRANCLNLTINSNHLFGGQFSIGKDTDGKEMSRNIIIANNVFSPGMDVALSGITMSGDSQMALENVLITGNQFNNLYTAINIDNDGSENSVNGAYFKNLAIIGNQFNNTILADIMLSRNNIDGIDISGNKFKSPQAAWNIYSAVSNLLTIDGNTFYGQDEFANQIGYCIQLVTGVFNKKTFILNNKFYNVPQYVIRLNSAIGKVTVDGNQAYQCYQFFTCNTYEQTAALALRNNFMEGCTTGISVGGTAIGSNATENNKFI